MKKLMIRLMGQYLNALSLIAPQAARKKLFALFCSPLATPIKPYQKEFLDTAIPSSFDIEGIRIQTYRWGDGPKKILFVHGWRSHTFRWKSYIEKFPKKEYTLYALDGPAHGLSGGRFFTVPLYSSAIERYLQIIGPVDTAITHSLGGFAMMMSLYEHPGLPVKKLVVMASPGEVADFTENMRGMLGLSGLAVKRLLAEFKEKVAHPLEYFSSARFAATLMLPGLIIHDEHDLDAPYRYAQQVHALWKGSRLITTTGIGHNLKSPEVLQWVEEFAAAAPVSV